MSELTWYWAYIPYLDMPDKQKESALGAGYDKVVFKYEADKVIADLEESHKRKVEQLLKEIAELKRQIEFLNITHNSCGDCTKCADGMGKVFDENLDELKAQKAQAEDDAAFWKKKYEDAKATHYAESVDAGMRERRLKRALWLARAERAKDKQAYYTHIRGDGWVHLVDKWINVERKCLKKAEEYK